VRSHLCLVRASFGTIHAIAASSKPLDISQIGVSQILGMLGMCVARSTFNASPKPKASKIWTSVLTCSSHSIPRLMVSQKAIAHPSTQSRMILTEKGYACLSSSSNDYPLRAVEGDPLVFWAAVLDQYQGGDWYSG